ncbi:TraM recognition domain-containing protein [Haladaptatus halobius]|uniref:TraM recognition domain-containing protein n=1 Tax=Haladaptatus halobius TaxID=2884875 RepID=UPI001D0A2C61|nr:type IV secretory system conjugative DNA transfer family protein [Haladaptatus halobius]
MGSLASVRTTLQTLVDQLVRWGLQSSDNTTILIAVGVGTLLLGLFLGFYLVRWLGRTFLHLGIWLGTTGRDLLVDAVRRRRTADDGKLDETYSREYLRIRPTSAKYDPNTLVHALERLHTHHQKTESGLNRSSENDEVLELLVATHGANAGVEFYVGGTVSLDRLAAALPYQQCGFDIDRVSTHPAQILNPEQPEAVVESSTAKGGSPSGSPPELPIDSSSPQPATDGAGQMNISNVDNGDSPPETGKSDDPTEALVSQLTASGREPIVYRLETQASRRKDWMMGLRGLTDLLGGSTDTSASPTGHSGSHPLGPLIDHLDTMASPALYQVTARSFRTWDVQADARQCRIEEGTDTLGQQLSTFIFEELLTRPESDETENRHHRTHHQQSRPRRTDLPRGARKRLQQLDQKHSPATFVATIRFAAIPTEKQSRAAVANSLHNIWSGFDHLEQDYYRLTSPPSPLKERIAGALYVRGARHRQRLRRLCNRQVVTPLFGHTRVNFRKRWPDLVCSADELAAWMAIPSTASLPSEHVDAIEHEPAHARPLRRPPTSVRNQYVGQDKIGRTAGYLLTADGDPDLEQPFRLPVSTLETHGLRQGLPNCGKTTDMAHDVVEDHRATDGPTIVITGPGGDLADHIMRAVAVEEGIEHLREHVHWFRVPTVQPGLAFFDIRELRSAADVTNWADAASDVADKYVEVVKALMGAEAFERAPLAADTLRALIAAGFDPTCYPSQPDDDSLLMPHREQESPWVYRFWQLEAQAGDLADLTRVMSETDFFDAEASLPDVSHSRLARNLSTPFSFEQRTTANIMGGVQTRLRALSNNLRLAALFDNTVEQFGFHTILAGSDSDDLFIFDLSALTPVSQRAYAITLLSLLDLQLRPKQHFLEREVSDDFLVNLHIDEAAQLVDTPQLGEFLDVIRNYNVGLNFAVQYPEQMRERGGERTYTSVLSNIQTTILGPSELSDEQAKRLCPAGWKVDEFQAHVRDLPESHRLVLLPPQGEKTRPQVFELHRGPLPEWHPAATEGPFTDPAFRQQFAAAKDDITERTQAEYGLPAGESEQEIREQRELGVPEVADAIGLARDNLAAFLALMTHHAQQAAAVDSAAAADARPAANTNAVRNRPVEESNGTGDPNASATPSSPTDTDETPPWVPVSEVYSRFMTQIDVALTDVDADEATAATETLPDNDDIATCMDESAYFETALAADMATSTTAGTGQDEGATSGVVVRLTPKGQQVAVDLDDPGEGATAGSVEHTALLKQVQQALQRVGEIQLVTQDGSAQPDAVGGLQRTVNGDTETVKLTVEAERSTFRHPTKPLQNLKKAQERDAVALFAVPAGNPDEGQAKTAHAERLADILVDPLNRQRDEPRYYVSADQKLTFHGGAHEGGETVVRRITDETDSGRSTWMHRDGTAVLVAPDGEEVATIDDFDAVVDEGQLDQFPAYYTYDLRTNQYTVHEHGQHHRYEKKADVDEEWVAVKHPFIPERELPVPNYGPTTYAILVVRDANRPATHGADGTATETDVALYLDGELQPLERLTDALQTGQLHPATASVSDPADDDAEDHGIPNMNGEQNTRSVGTKTRTTDQDNLSPKQAGVADFAKLLDEPAPDERASDRSDRDDQLRSDHVLDVYQKVEAQKATPIYERRSDLSRELRKYLGFRSKEVRDPTASGKRYTWWVGVVWRTATVETIAEKIIDETDDERIGELVEILEITTSSEE